MKANAKFWLLVLVVCWFAMLAVAQAQTTIIWTDSFERADPTDQWSVDNGIWSFGNPTTGPGLNSAGYRTHDGTNCAGAVLNGTYPANTSSRLIRTTPFVVPSASQNPRLQFWHWFAFSGNSYGVVEVKYGTNNWAEVSPRYYGNGSGVWTRPVVDLSGYAGKAVQLAFQIVTDGNLNNGWDVDQVSVIKGPYTVGFTNGATESFENGMGDWYAETGTWEVGVPTSGPSPNSYDFNSAPGMGWSFSGSSGIDAHSGTFYTPVAPGGNQAAFIQNATGTNGSISQMLSFSTSGTYSIAFACVGRAGSLGPNTIQVQIDGSPVYTLSYSNQSQSVWQTNVATYICTNAASHTLSFVSMRMGGDFSSCIDNVAVTGPASVNVVNPNFATPSITGYLYQGRSHGGFNCAATVLGGNYAGNIGSRFDSPPFVVPTADQNPRLRFWSWYSIGAYDFCEMQIKVGTNGWQVLHHYTSTSSGVWTQQGFDLSAYAGQTVQLGFYLQSGNAGCCSYATSPSPGWYVDEVALVTGPIQTLQPNVPVGFESGWGDWYAEGGTWEIGAPTYGPPTNSLGQRAYAGTNCAATVLAGNYAGNTYGRLDSPPFAVPTADQNPRLRFWSWYNIGGYDYCEMQIKAGTNDWQTLQIYTSTGSGVWSRQGFDLSAYAGQTVQLGFYFQSGNAGCCSYATSPSPGWYVDEVALVTGPIQTLQPNVPVGFEFGWGDWYAEGGTWEIGTPTYGPPTNSLGQRAYAGTNCAATVLAGNYAGNTYGRLDSPAFVVPDVGTHPNLRFWHWFSIGSYDFCQLQLKPTGGSWKTLAQYNAGNSAVWSRPSFDLSQYAGQTVQLGFYFQSGNAGCCSYATSPSPGWYVDEVEINSATPPTGIVQFTDVRYFVNNGETNATISFERKYGSSGAVSVTFVATDGTAAGGVDFDSVVDTISWADGEQGVKTDIVPIHQDPIVEGNKTVTLQLVVPGAVASTAALENSTLVIIDGGGLPVSTNVAYLRSEDTATNYAPVDTNTLFTVGGTVTTYANLSANPPDEMFFMQDNTNGIAVYFRNGTNQFMPQAGDRIQVTASLTNLNGLLALAPDYNNLTNVVWRLSSSNSLPAPTPLNFAAQTNVAVMESLEAQYVTASQVTIDQTSGTNFPTVLTNLMVTNLTGQTFQLTINPNTDIAGQAKPTGRVVINGVLTQNDPTAPYTTNYALLPTRYADITANIPGNPGVLQFAITNVWVSEVGGAASLTVNRTVGSSGAVSVNYATVPGTALAGTDFVATNNVLNWADGETGPKTITVAILNDLAQEPDEAFIVALSSATGGVVLSNSVATVNIANADYFVQPASQTVAHGSNAAFSITPAGSVVSMQWLKNGAPVPGMVGPALNLTNVQAADSAGYSVVITNVTGVVTSSVATLTVLKATPVITWTNPAVIIFGTALSSAQLNASANVPGAFAYTPTNGVVLNAGTNALTAVFTPADTANYFSTTSTVSVVVLGGVAPTIITQPVSQTNFAGNPVTLAVAAVGGAPLAYQWYFGGSLLTAATNTTFNIASALVANGGAYQVAVTNAYGSVTSSVAQLTVLKATPAIAWTNPAAIFSGTALSGVQLNASASVGGAFVYAPANGAVLGIGTNALTAVFTPTDTADYNSVTDAVSLVVLPVPPAITVQPASQTNTVGNPVTFAVTATGTVPLAYQWYFGSGAVAGAKNATYNLASVLAANAGGYKVVVTNASGSVTSSVAALTVLKATPVIAWTNPAAITCVATLGSGQLNATSSVAGSFGYSPVSGSTLPLGTNLLTVAFTPADTADYNNATDAVSVVVVAAPPVITGPPASQTNTVGQPVTFAVTATSCAALGYQWYFGASPLAGATNTTYNLASVLAANAGGYKVVVTNTSGSVTSSVATLTVLKATPVITWAAPAPITYGTALSGVQLNATASVAGSKVYTPASGTVPPVGTQVLTVVFTPTDTADYNSVTDTVSLVVGGIPPAITTPPVSQTNTVCNPVTFTVTATGTAPLRYQWYLGGSPVAGATTNVYTIGSVLVANAGAYQVVITNTAGSVTSSVANLTVLKATPVLTWPTPGQITYGTALGGAQLNATAAVPCGSVPGSYVYTPGAGTLLNVGSYTLAVLFTPNDLADYYTATDAVNLVVLQPVTNNLVLNGGFEAGSFTNWTRSGNLSEAYVVSVTNNAEYVLSGTYGGQFGPSLTLGYLAQGLPTQPGEGYLLSWWLNSHPTGGSTTVFQASWNGANVYAVTNLGATGWTNLAYKVTATGTNTVLQFGFRSDGSSLFGLDNVIVSPLTNVIPRLLGANLAGTNLVLSGVYGVAGETYVVLTSTNLTQPPGQWTPVATNLLNTNGNFTLTATNVVVPKAPKRFYILQAQ